MNTCEQIYTVSSFTREVKQLLEASYGNVEIDGELSSITKHSSGHWYFTIKDSKAQLSCVMFRGDNRRVLFQPEEGQQLRIKARASVYEARGNFQLIVSEMKQTGDGELQRQFELLKKKLDNEGLFKQELKKTIPAQACRIAVITSPTGAAIRDVISVFKRRFPLTEILLLPVPVQGKEAAPAIARALASVSAHTECDAVLLVRGGGSLEDLWAFNEEIVARAIHQCTIPVISGVGHESDNTIADYVADARAATPTAAAEMVTPDQDAWQQRLSLFTNRLQQFINNRIAYQQQQLLWLQKRLQQQHPQTIIRGHSQKLDDIEQRFIQSHRYQQGYKNQALTHVLARLRSLSPVSRLAHHRQSLNALKPRLKNTITMRFKASRSQLVSLARTLGAVSPLQTLARGFSISMIDDRAITDSAQAQVGDVLKTRLRWGAISSRVESIEDTD